MNFCLSWHSLCSILNVWSLFCLHLSGQKLCLFPILPLTLITVPSTKYMFNKYLPNKLMNGGIKYVELYLWKAWVYKTELSSTTKLGSSSFNFKNVDRNWTYFTLFNTDEHLLFTAARKVTYGVFLSKQYHLPSQYCPAPPEKLFSYTMFSFQCMPLSLSFFWSVFADT